LLPQLAVIAFQQLLLLSPLLQQTYLYIIGGIIAIAGAIILVIIGIAVIVLIVGAAIFLLPAIIVGIIIWFFTASLFYAGIGFFIVALISLVRRA
jgi:hypothetical protein